MCAARCFFSGLLCLALAHTLWAADGKSANSAKSKRRPPTVQEVEKAFRGKTEQSRISLYVKLRRAGENADLPEIVAALTAGLTERLEKKTFDPGDLQLEALLADFPSTAATEALTTFLAADDPRAVIIALRSLADSARSPSWDQVLPVTERDDYAKLFALRRGVVLVAEQNGSKQAIDFLVETISKADGQLKYEIARTLTALTGQKFGGDEDRWADWWLKARDEFPEFVRRDRMSGTLLAEMPWKERVPRFYRLPVYARRVLFVIDHSGSMNIVDGEVSRIDRARWELVNAISQLPEETRFDILSFHDVVTPFSPRLVPATEESKENAFRFARNLVAAHNTNCYDALTLALNADPNVEAIYFLSDGEPTTGGIIEPTEIVEAISRQNQLRMTAIYTLGIGAYGAHEDFLKKLAQRNFGEFFPIQ